MSVYAHIFFKRSLSQLPVGMSQLPKPPLLCFEVILKWSRGHLDKITVNLITKMASEWLAGRQCASSVDPLDAGWLAVGTGRSRTSATFAGGMRVKIYQWFISGIFHFKFSDCNWLQVTEALKTKIVRKGATQKSRHQLKSWAREYIGEKDPVYFCSPRPWATTITVNRWVRPDVSLEYLWT